MNDQKKQITDKEAKRLLFFAKIFLVVSCIGLALSLPAIIKDRVHPPQPYELAQRFSKPEALTKHIRVAEHDMLVPLGYFKVYPDPGVEQTDVLLITLYPDFEPLKETSYNLWEKGEWFKHVMIHIGTSKQYKSLPDFVDWARRFNKATLDSGEIYGLRYYTRHQGIKSSTDDVFVSGAVENPKTVITCNSVTENLEYHPQCRHLLEWSNIRISISYDRKFLPQWGAIEGKTKFLLQTFSESYHQNKQDNL